MKARIFEHINEQGQRRLAIENRTGRVDWPIRYTDGRIAYDCPEFVPASIKKELARRFNTALNQEKQYFNDFYGR